MNVAALLLLFLLAAGARAFSSSGKGFGKSSSSASGGGNAFVSFDRFRASCPADPGAIRQFAPGLIKDDGSSSGEDVWVAVYRSANNLPSVFVRDSFMDAMRASTTVQGGDSETIVSAVSSTTASGVISNSSGGSSGDSDTKPVAVARLAKGDNCYILDSMRCVLKKENTDADCDGGSEHAEAIGVCIDELVLSYLNRYLEEEASAEGGTMSFDGGIHFRGTLVSGKLLDSRGFREVSELSADMHSHESDFDGALSKYAERSASKDVAKNPGARDRALKIVGCLSRIDRDEDKLRAAALQQQREDRKSVV